MLLVMARAHSGGAQALQPDPVFWQSLAAASSSFYQYVHLDCVHLKQKLCMINVMLCIDVFPVMKLDPQQLALCQSHSLHTDIPTGDLSLAAVTLSVIAHR